MHYGERSAGEGDDEGLDTMVLDAIFNHRDFYYMRLALDEARKAAEKGNIPIGAVLLIDGKLISSLGNNQFVEDNYFSHAESLLIGKYAKEIKDAHKSLKNIELYTTLEPCLMCFGTAVHNRVNRIIFSCPDQVAGATSIKPITDWYSKRWPLIFGDILKEESASLLLDYMRKRPEEWKSCVISLEKIVNDWEIRA